MITPVHAHTRAEEIRRQKEYTRELQQIGCVKTILKQFFEPFVKMQL